MYKTAPDLPQFPDKYPTGVLLGRVELVDIFTCEDYKQNTPNHLQEESECKFKYIINNPMKLLVPIKMIGSKKIYTLDFQLWEGASRGLRRIYTK